MKILVTGGSGFIGRHLLPLLEGHEVHVISRYPFETPFATVHRCDLFEPTQIAHLIHQLKAEVLVHLAWDTTPCVYAVSPANLEWLTASLRLFEAFVRAGGKRIVGAGTCAEYGKSDGLCHEDDTPINPETLYGAAKASLFFTTSRYAKQRGFSFAWGRIFYPYGPWEKAERLIPQLIASIGKPFSIRNYHQITDFVHVEDVARSFLALIEQHIEGAVNIGSGRGIKLGELGKMITEVPHVSGIETRLVANTKKLERLVKPEITLEEGIKQTIAWRQDAPYY